MLKKFVRAIQDGRFVEKTLAYISNRAANFFKEFIENFYCCFPIIKNKIVFDNFGGKGYGDNPKYIAEEIHRRKLPWDMVWLVHNMDEPMPDYIRKVRFGSARSLYELTTAKMWVDNVRNAHLIPKKEGQVYLQTWHGLGALKKCEGAIENNLPREYVREARIDGEISDGIISGSRFDSELYRKDFWLNDRTEILEYGLPRNDAFQNKKNRVCNNQKVRDYYQIPPNVGILLYMPTFRDDGSEDAYITDFETLRAVFEQRFGRKVVILARFHPNAECLQKRLTYSRTLINATTYPDPQELYAAADYLVSDYSSTADEFGILNKPVFRCILDFEKIKYRLNEDVFALQPYPVSFSFSKLLEDVLQFHTDNYDNYHVRLGYFPAQNASGQTVDWLIKKVKR